MSTERRNPELAWSQRSLVIIVLADLSNQNVGQREPNRPHTDRSLMHASFAFWPDWQAPPGFNFFVPRKHSGTSMGNPGKMANGKGKTLFKT